MTMVHHTGLCPADVEQSLRFYRDGIGMTVLADFTMDADLEPLLGRRTSHVRAVFLGTPDSPQGGTLELLDLGDAELTTEPGGSGLPHRGVFLLSFVVDVPGVLTRLADLGLGGEPRTMPSPGGITATVVDPDGVTVELLSGPVTMLPSG
ncbi:VOC family protein [Mycolicibacterium hodleri]|uniref:VOC family protein n=1 Tax=Mycolicibacterium hodleri TaxID=49897 RepID=A0A502E544_9MYCO|nr:VOC family protein [Mycolicibacterium hodleri]TPG31676.1 VOC family protein [Mycolicibacterium hodleri]